VTDGAQPGVTPGDDLEILFDAAAIAAAVSGLAAAIVRDSPAGEPVTLVGVLKGALFLTADLARALPADMDVRLDFLSVSSYRGGVRPNGEVRLLKDTSDSVEGKNVVLVEDIADTGWTLAYLQDILRSRRPASLRTCVLLDKPARRETPVSLEYAGLTIPDRFIVGYGLDYQEKYRSLPYIAAVRPSKGIG
jgi:hypoxanthine phosphoribosyltransferase